MTIVARHILIFGRVQGVGFRAFVERLALQRDIEGWVRNRRDGSVEAFFTGSPDDVAWIVDLCGRGPRASSVTQVDDLVPDSTRLGMRRPGERFSMLATV